MAAGHPSPAKRLIPSRRNHNRPPADAAAPSNGSHLNKLPSQTFKSKKIYLWRRTLFFGETGCFFAIVMSDFTWWINSWMASDGSVRVLSNILWYRPDRTANSGGIRAIIRRMTWPDDEYSHWVWVESIHSYSTAHLQVKWTQVSASEELTQVTQITLN